MKERQKKVSVTEIVTSVLFVILLIFFCFELWFSHRYTAVHVEGGSMNDTLNDGDWVYADESVQPKRGDVVTIDVRSYLDASGRPLFRESAGGGGYRPIEIIIKRIVALEGDAVRCVGGVVSVRYTGTEEFVPLGGDALGSPADFAEVGIGEGEMFVMGDNRATSYDSTEVGPLRLEHVVGVVPQWSIDHKATVTGWENFRSGIFG